MKQGNYTSVVPVVATADTGPQSDAVAELIARMHREGLTARRDPVNADRVILVRQTNAGSLGAGSVARHLVETAVEEGSLIRQGQAQFVLPGAIANHEADRRAPDSAPPHDTQVVRINDAESPFLWLHRRKGADGQPLLDDVHVQAGERFRRDVTIAAMLPSVTANWSRLEQSTGRSAPRDPALASDATIAARQRVRAVFRRLGSGMGHFVLDTCGFLVPLQDAEARRGWPARSGKLVLKLALTQLAEHYGLGQTATGPGHGKITAWQGPGDKADLTAWIHDTQ